MAPKNQRPLKRDIRNKAASNSVLTSSEIPEGVNLFVGKIPHRIVRRDRLFEEFREAIMLVRESGSYIEIMLRSKNFPAQGSRLVSRHADTISGIYHVYRSLKYILIIQGSESNEETKTKAIQ